jgi:hypothetical protein
MAKEIKTKDVQVHVRHVGELETVNFKISEEATLLEVWTKAYDELGIDKEERDALQAKHGNESIDLAPHLSVTLRQALSDGIITTLHFEIVAGTGGA